MYPLSGLKKNAGIVDKVAAIYDIHGNLPALEAVLKDIERLNADLIVAGGDVLSGPMPGDCLNKLSESPIPVQYIRGNCERQALALLDGDPLDPLPEKALEDIKWTSGQISKQQIGQITKWPEKIELRIEGLGTVLFCHATPRNDTEIFTKLTGDDKLKPVFNSVKAGIVVCGHTHMQFDRIIGNIRVINAGSVGMPFGNRGAYWLLLDTKAQLKKSTYDYVNAAAIIKESNYPWAFDFAENYVLNPPDEEKMLEIFSHGEL